MKQNKMCGVTGRPCLWSQIKGEKQHTGVEHRDCLTDTVHSLPESTSVADLNGQLKGVPYSCELIAGDRCKLAVSAPLSHENSVDCWTAGNRVYL